MGWNPYNAYACDTVESQYHSNAQALVDLGLDSLGYEYLNLDCGWQGTARNSSGGITWNTAAIPNGVPALGKFVHDLGLKFGVYSDGGYFACDTVGGTAHFLGSLGFEMQDAATFASWGADYLKYDNCYAVSTTDFVDFDPPIEIEPHYTTMRDALSATDRPILFSACEWGVQVSAKSPLIISTDLTEISEEAVGILTNTRVIALNQDSLGQSISFKRRYTNDHDVWAGPLSDGSMVAVVIEMQNSSRAITFKLSDVGYTSATAINVITGALLGTLENSYTSTFDAHGSLVLKLSNPVIAPQPTFTFYDAAASGNVLAGGASTRIVNNTITVVGFVGNGGTLEFTGVDGGASGGTKLLSVDYINADFTPTNTDCSNCRNAFMRVNGGTAVQVQMPLSGQSWDILFHGYLVSLSGFIPGKTNTVQISNPSAYTPDFYRLGVVV
ncbi:hypothetical protein HHX47_DHR4000588 [Lentinula edodes]|nr:hypothetical protein HHX47_DHR4000588 [Lentinula edodes]